MSELSHYLRTFNAGHISSLRGIKRGLEKEALRITPKGALAQTPHPESLGSSLTHPHITTDFSEALMEFITPPCDSISSMLTWMDEIHRFTYQQIHKQGELLWMASMPCAIDSEELIPIAKYGSSNSARMKHIYRIGLSHRYGRTMQTIAGIHYNFSFPDEFWLQLQKIDKRTDSLQDYKTEKYFALIRNFRRYFWLLLYLFGAAPAACPTFVKQRQHSLEKFQNHSLYYPFATSLRMGELGYQSKAQASIMADYNSLHGYTHSLLLALTTPHSDYEKIGARNNGEYKQLSCNLLQIENEFYSTIRPKRVTRRGETPIHAMRERGVEYVEVRSIDINPFNTIGIDSVQAHFIETFLLFCLLEESPPTNADEYKQIAENQRLVVNEGRNPHLEVFCHGSKINLRLCSKNLLDKLKPLAALLDQAIGDSDYSLAVEVQIPKLHDEHKTPSAHMLDTMTKNELSFFKMAYKQSCQYQDYFLAHPLAADRQKYFENMAKESITAQKNIESSDNISFEQYLNNYFQQYKAGI
jgi:glutamate--cysteine ligase